MSYPQQQRNPGNLPSESGAAQVYQIDFTAVASGKRIATSKRRIRWRFGFANPQALAAGATGTACRGEEHDITLVWSITSGKRLVLADGQEVHCSSNRGSVFDFSWTMRGNHVLKIMAHSSPPLSATPGFRQYDFYIDGQSFFTFPKVFRLGLTPNDPGWMPSEAAQFAKSSERRAYGSGPPSAGPGAPNRLNSGDLANLEAPHNYDEEEAYLKVAIENSLNETGPQPASGGGQDRKPAISSQGQDLLLDFFSDTASQPSITSPTAAPPAPFAALPPSTTANAVQPSVPMDPWGAPAPAQPYGGYGAPQPAANPVPALPASTTAIAPPYGQPPAPITTSYAGYGAPPPQQQTSPYGAIVAPTPTGQYPGAPQPSSPYGVPPTTPTAGQQQQTYGAPPPTQYLQQPQVSAGSYGAQYPPAPPAAAPNTANPFASPPPPAQTVPGADFAAPPTPSTMGFASPAAVNGLETPSAPAPGGYGVAPQQPSPTTAPTPPDFGAAPDFAAAPAPQTSQPPDFGAASDVAAAPASADPAAFTMNSLSGQGPDLGAVTAAAPSNVSLADQAYAKFANMATFELSSKSEAPKANPFDAPSALNAPIGGTVSLAEMKKNTPKKEVMRNVGGGAQQQQTAAAAAAPSNTMNSMVLSSTQNGNNWGAQFAQPTQQPAYGVYGQQQQQQQQQQAPPAYGGYGQQQQQQAPPVYGGYGQQQQPMYGQQQQQQPPQQQAYGQYGQPQY
eukprot:CAMPEP_0202451964 /NCGR_PEP_ID=MMETSP1360-20130828/10258_1 /ASSEMBLY_ACC=CAM_ASM_000848 /TAXON_ID=515479 /ORGANISM="Licmophora paradoxa, Strain CCMP2313" /LENGTH=731 /DNA_ID=CAMNT_0049070647 /DNA_START=23 /DNA_END=2218 /DNA_ORIENTATION=+